MPFRSLPAGTTALVHVVPSASGDATALGQALTRWGYRVQTFRNFQAWCEGLGVPGHEGPQAVVLLGLERTGGEGPIDLAGVRERLGSGPALLVVSDRGDMPSRLRAVRAGVVRYMVGPVVPEQVRAALDEIQPQLRLQPYRVLMVDDVPAMLEQQAQVLRAAGMEVRALLDPFQALQALQDFRPDVVVLDMHMPGISGPEVAAVLRQLDDQQHLPILFLSGEHDLTRQMLALRQGGDDFLLKPVRPPHLVAAVTVRAERSRRHWAVLHRLDLKRYEREREHMALDHHAIVSVADRDGTIVYANDKFCEISGYSRVDLLGHNHRMLNSGTQPRGFFEDMWATITKGDVWVGEVCNRRKDGSLYWVESSITPFMDEAGLPYQYISVRTDITHLKNTELALRAARDEADRANRAKSEFLSSMSHELRTPLHAILGFSQLLQYDKQLSEKQKNNILQIRKAGDHLLALIDEVLDLAKIESGRIDLSSESVEMGALVRECLILVQPLAAARNIDIRQGPMQGRTVRADRSRLKQVLLNLLSNAIKYNRESGTVRVDVLAQADGMVQVAVQDSGHGIAADRLQELFKPFTRLDADKHRIEGTGIGLSITKRIMELMGGTVGVSSELGVGSRFWVGVPAEHPQRQAGEAPRRAPGRAPEKPLQRQRQLLLYIEDNPANIELVEQILTLRPDLSLQTAHLPGLGIDLARALRPDLILLDTQPPGHDGCAVLQALRKEPGLQDLPVLAVMSNAMPRDVQRCLEAGFADVVPKPFDVAGFLAKIDARLARQPLTAQG